MEISLKIVRNVKQIIFKFKLVWFSESQCSKPSALLTMSVINNQLEVPVPQMVVLPLEQLQELYQRMHRLEQAAQAGALMPPAQQVGYHAQPQVIPFQQDAYHYPQVVPFQQGPGYYPGLYPPSQTQVVPTKATGRGHGIGRYNISNAHREAFSLYAKLAFRVQQMDHLVVHNNHPTEALEIAVKQPTFALTIRLPPLAERGTAPGGGCNFQRAVYYSWSKKDDPYFKQFLEDWHFGRQGLETGLRYMCFPGFHFETANNVVWIAKGKIDYNLSKSYQSLLPLYTYVYILVCRCQLEHPRGCSNSIAHGDFSA